jgi:hypothetical protein
MANILRQKDGTTAATALTCENIGNDLQIRIGVAGAGKGGEIYVKEAKAANGDLTYRWHRTEPPAK